MKIKKKSKVTKQSNPKKCRTLQVKRKIGKKTIKVRRKVCKNPVKLTPRKLQEIINRPGVDSEVVTEFLNNSFVKSNYRETVLRYLHNLAKDERLNLATVKAIREAYDLNSGYVPSERDFVKYNEDSGNYENDYFLHELTGPGTTYPRLSKKRGNWY